MSMLTACSCWVTGSNNAEYFAMIFRQMRNTVVPAAHVPQLMRRLTRTLCLMLVCLQLFQLCIDITKVLGKDAELRMLLSFALHLVSHNKGIFGTILLCLGLSRKNLMIARVHSSNRIPHICIMNHQIQSM